MMGLSPSEPLQQDHADVVYRNSLLDNTLIVTYKTGLISLRREFSKINVLGDFIHGFPAVMGLSLLIVEVSRSHSDTPHSVGLFWTSE